MVPICLSQIRPQFHGNMRNPCKFDIYLINPVGGELTLGLRVGFISSHLTADKLLKISKRATTGSPKMSHPLEVKSTPASIIKSKLLLVSDTDDLGRYITSNQQREILVQKPQ